MFENSASVNIFLTIYTFAVLKQMLDQNNTYYRAHKKRKDIYLKSLAFLNKIRLATAKFKKIVSEVSKLNFWS